MTTPRFVVTLALLPLLFLLVPATQPVHGDDDFQPMFNGKDLSGWEGLPGRWDVRDGAIVGESTEARPVPKTHYLYWKGGEPADFEVRFRYRISGHANSGLQFRSEARPDFNTWGYQADLDVQGRYTGCLYQHGRALVAQRGQKVLIDAQGKKTITKFAEPNELLKAINRDGWNEYHVLAQGSRIVLSINGVRMCEVEDYEAKYALPKGILALQMHKGLPMKAEFKDLRIRVIR